MNLNDSGLPLPGPELDAAVWEMLGHEVEWKWWERVDDDDDRLSLFLDTEQKIKSFGDPASWTHRLKRKYKFLPAWEWKKGWWEMVPEVSTTHAFFQVGAMGETEADYVWTAEDDGECITVVLQDRYGQEWDHYCSLVKYSSREAAFAHAVCCCAWKALKGESDARA